MLDYREALCKFIDLLRPLADQRKRAYHPENDIRAVYVCEANRSQCRRIPAILLVPLPGAALDDAREHLYRLAQA